MDALHHSILNNAIFFVKQGGFSDKQELGRNTIKICVIKVTQAQGSCHTKEE